MLNKNQFERNKSRKYTSSSQLKEDKDNINFNVNAGTSIIPADN